MNKIIEKCDLVGIAADLFRMKGYSATSIDDIAKACGLSKGSLYHHFSGKEELAMAALDQVHQHYRDKIFSIIQESENPTVKEFQAFNGAVEDFFARHPHGCLLANLSLEVGAPFEPFSKKIAQFFDDWIACYAKVFAHYFAPAAAKLRAEDALAIVQGCVLMHRIRGNLQPLRRQHAGLVESCKRSSEVELLR